MTLLGYITVAFLSSSSAESNYTWANNCLLPVETVLWKSGEPGSLDSLVTIARASGNWKYTGIGNTAKYRPLCQSSEYSQSDRYEDCKASQIKRDIIMILVWGHR